MLDETRCVSIKSVLGHNICNVLFLLIFWSGFYCLCFGIAVSKIKGEVLDFGNILSLFIGGYYHLWYLFMMIGLYLITPFLREFVRKENRLLAELFILVALATHFTIPILKGIANIWVDANFIVEYIQKFYLDFFDGFIAYYITGWYIVYIGIKRRYVLYILGILSIVTTFVYVQLTKDYSNGYSNYNAFVFFYSVAIFVMLNSVSFAKVSEKTKKYIILFSKLTFGVYVIHPLYLTLIDMVFTYGSNPFVYILVKFIICSLLSFASCYIGSKLPVLKKLLKT